jgi:acetyl-CoA carboxylase, biotin carboxylase subunit
MEAVLIANRGEIALRVIRACRELGLRSVAVYSDPDRNAPHVQLADEAYRLGPAPSAESYLRADRLLEVAHQARVDAIHPGYGFLSERAPFARAVEAAGFRFVGPSAETIEAMGDKTRARQRMAAAGVPIVPGTTTPLRDAEEAVAVARDIGFPVLLKASAGGGGKGMRVVEAEDACARAFEAAAREATAAFGDGAVYVEKYLGAPRHIEIQLLGDSTGRVIHLGERECSIQRRHQKLVEEAPSPILDAATRAAMGQAAVRAAEAVNYVGAGTVEFLWQDGAFFFLEMNTRIQVEHPVTEFITGIDLVQWQLRVASGEALPWTQDDIQLRGHAIECRVTAEDPDAGFLPATGRIAHLEIPGGPGVRWDGGIARGTEVGLHYDPLLGKLITYAPSRPEAIRRMARALRELVIDGVSTSVPFHLRVMEEPDFRAGTLTIRYLEEHPELLEGREAQPPGIAAAEAAAIVAALEREYRDGLRPARPAGITFAPAPASTHPPAPDRPGSAAGPGPDPEAVRPSAWQQAFHPAMHGH